MSRARVGGLALDLLGRHVAQRAHHDARLCTGGGGGHVGLRAGAGLRLRQLGEAEVEDLDAAFVRDEEVLGLEVPMHDALVVRRGQAMRDLEGIVDRLARREAAGRELRSQRLAFQKFLNDVRRTVVAPDVVDRRDVGMVQDARGLRFLLEAAQAVRVGRERRRQHLDRDVAPEPGILRAIDLAHSTGADRLEDLVGAELRASRESHFLAVSGSVTCQMSALSLERMT